MSGPATTPTALLSRERALKALSLRKMGLTYDQVAAQCGYKTRHGAIQAVRRYLAKYEAADVEEYRKLELERLEALESILAPRVFPKKDDTTGLAPKPDLQAIDRLLGIKHMKFKLLGLYAPTKTELTGPDGGPVQFDDARGRFLGRIEAILERQRVAVRVVGSGTGGDGDGVADRPVSLAGGVGEVLPAPAGG